ncbi:hypothetical protein [Mycetocola reblochoni]|uniref:hypothetical protein n=1 Tax=Mycetocola reblochoni TaxID=331618 RepID=UPI0011C39395|nr:hypothetical protein [Mycetocola reblochoni]
MTTKNATPTPEWTNLPDGTTARVGELLEYGANLRIPAWWEHAGVPLDSGSQVQLRADWDVREQAYAVTRLSVQDDQTAITSTTLRAIPLTRLVAARSVLAMESNGQIRLDEEWMSAPIALATIARRAGDSKTSGPTADNLSLLAHVYDYNAVTTKNPLKAVSAQMDIPERTASHWIKLARERGYLSSGIPLAEAERRAARLSPLQ